MSANEELKTQLEVLRAVDERLAQIADEAADLTARKTLLETVVLPDLFAQAGVTEVKTENGARAKMGLVASGSLPKDDAKRKAAIEWLVENGYGEIIEAKVVASWARGDREKAEGLFEQLKGDNSVKLSLDDSVNHMTLGKLAKERVQQGLEVPLDTLGVNVISRVRFTSKGAVQ